MSAARGDRRLRVGTVSYLNSVPLNVGLDQDPHVRLEYNVPSVLADRLEAGELDVGLVPVFEVIRCGAYRVVPHVAIACVGPVLSVKLFSRLPLRDVRSVALDPSSRTSAALTRWLLEGEYGLRPEYVHGEPGSDVTMLDADAALVIGDPALRWTGTAHEEIDLGDAWYRATGLPFVFAVWAVRREAARSGLADRFIEAKRKGVKEIPAIAARESRRRDLPESLCLTYLRDHICFDLEAAQLAGLRWFAALAEECGLIDSPAPSIDRLLLADSDA